MNNIKHDLDARFYVEQDGEEAVLNYSREGECLNFLRVYVPPIFRGQGLAAKLTCEAFEYAKSKGYQVIPTCPYISETFLARYPEYLEFVKR